MGHLLNLRELANEHVGQYALLGFEGREAMSELFEYRLELITDCEPKLSEWIGQLAEFDVSPDGGDQRVFAGRIYGARWVESSENRRIHVLIRPAFHATNYARATHFVQDKDTMEIFGLLAREVRGQVSAGSVNPPPPKRGYAVRYEETEFDFLSRLLAQDGITYFFVYDRAAGSYRHKMVVTNQPSDYVDIPTTMAHFLPNSAASAIDRLERAYQAASRSTGHVGINVNKLDTPFVASQSATERWGQVTDHRYDAVTTEAMIQGDVLERLKAADEQVSQAADQVAGTSNEPTFHAGARVELMGADGIAPKRVVMTSVVHSAYDPWMLSANTPARYTNRFTAIDATKSFRPSADAFARRAPGPVLGTIAAPDGDASADGKIVIDKEWRVPVSIEASHHFSFHPNGKPDVVWLPVQQQWSHATHGAQFFPRTGSRVIIDFLYGNPDLPIVVGSMYHPSHKYPFDPNKTPTQSGWRSVTDGNGRIVQEFRFEDKPGKEEVYLHTGRDYRRIVDNNDWGTVKANQTLAVYNDQKLEVGNDRTIKVTGKQQIDIVKTRTMKVVEKSTHESLKEIELVVGPSSIKINMQGIEITAPQIKINGTATVEVSANAMLSTKAPLSQHNGDGMMIIKGGLVMIN